MPECEGPYAWGADHGLITPDLIERRARYPTEQGVVPENLLRVSVGCEHADDLWDDLAQALAARAA